MKIFYTLLFFTLLSNGSFSQIFQSTSCIVDIYSNTPVEEIKAKNKNASSIINFTTGDIVFRVPNSGFKFDNALMEEHFNENYMETHKYPNCEFKGKIMQLVDWKKVGSYKVTVTGNLKAHGVEVERTISGTIHVKADVIIIESKFNVPLKDHKIEVPKLVISNLSDSIAVNIDANYAPFVKK